MKSRAGLKKQVKTIRGGGHRTYWVKANPKVEARKGNRQISAGEMLKAHGLQIAARGAAHGVGTYGVQIAGLHAGVRVGDFLSRKKSHYARGAYMLTGAGTGFLGASAASALGGHKLAYKGKRGTTIRTDYQRATLGGKVVSVGLHAAAHLIGWGAANSAHAHGQNYMARRGHARNKYWKNVNL